MSKSVVRISELSILTGLGRGVLRRMANSGQIPSEASAGGHRLFVVKDVKNALLVLKAVTKVDLLGITSYIDEEPSWEYNFDLTGLEEHLVWEKLKDEINLDMTVGAADSIPYAFNEMLNNAIDHSCGTTVNIKFWANSEFWGFEITDNGIGIFRVIKEGFNLDTIFESSQELTKGKRTTAPTKHSGEGIFFTSKSVDVFSLSSNMVTLVVDNVRKDHALGQGSPEPGTKVFVKLETNTVRRLTEIISDFSTDYNFTRTRPAISLFDIGVLFVSRSQARRLLIGLENFSEIEVDFNGVETVGQGFADELFRVWPLAHQDKKIIPINMAPAVEFMVKRTINTVKLTEKKLGQ